MVKVTDYEVANFISKRILELMDITDLPLIGLASYSGISYTALRSAKTESQSLTVDSFARLCSSLSIKFSDFFNPDITLSIGADKIPDLANFKTAFFEKSNQGNIPQPQSKFNTDLRKQREILAAIVYDSDYFLSAKTLEEMVIDFEYEYGIHFSKERLSVLLKKYIGLEILDKKVVPKRDRGIHVFRRPFLYFKKGTAIK
jgi:hypothetical protein